MRELGALVAALVLAACGAAEASDTPPPSSAAAPTVMPAATPVTSAPASPGPSHAATPSELAELVIDVVSHTLPSGSAPHDVAPAADGGVWYTGQGNGTTYPLNGPYAYLNTAAFDGDGILWFTGQAGIYGRLDPESGELTTYPAPRGTGPYGIATTPEGEVVFSSLAGSYIGLIDRASGEVTVVDTPTPGGGARRVWSDSAGTLWVTEWFAGMLAAYDPRTETWREWRLPGQNPQPYAAYVDETDAVWVSDFGANTLLRFDPATEEWTSLPLDSSPANVRQLLGRPGEVWGAESAADRVLVVRHDPG